MTAHQCPKCELRFTYKTEVDDHCWHDHPEFRHEYPAAARPHGDSDARTAPPPPATPRPAHHVSEGFGQWLVPPHRREPLRLTEDEAAELAQDGVVGEPSAPPLHDPAG